MKQKLLLLSMMVVCAGCIKPDPVARQIYHADPAFEKDIGYACAVRADNVPAATWVQVERLFSPELVVEVVAHFPAGG